MATRDVFVVSGPVNEQPFSIISLDRPRGSLVVVSGPSGVGKSSVVDGLAQRRPFHFSVSNTTRSIRSGERNGVDYHFLSRDEFLDQVNNGELLEWAEYGGNLYGTPKTPVLEQLATGADVLLDIENDGAKQIKQAFPEAVLVFLLPPSLDVLESRLRGRGDTAEGDVARRLAVAEEQIADAQEYFDHLVVNDDLDTAIDEVVSILDGYQRPDAPSVAPSSRSSHTAGPSGDSPSGDVLS